MPLWIDKILEPNALTLWPNASLNRLDTRAKCPFASTRYSGQIPLWINYILGPNALLDRLDTRAKCLSGSKNEFLGRLDTQA